MPEFGNAFSGLAAKRKLTHRELVRSLRFMVAAEYEAIQLYEQLAESTDNALARKVLVDIANEEKEHVGEFLRLLQELAPEDEPFYQDGREETEATIAEVSNAAENSCHGEGGCCCDESPAQEGACEKSSCCQEHPRPEGECGGAHQVCACTENKQRS